MKKKKKQIFAMQLFEYYDARIFKLHHLPYEE